MDEEEEGKYIEQIAREASLNAIKETFSFGLPIMTLQGDNIIKLYPDGKIEFIKKLEKSPVIPEKRIYKL